MIKCVLFDFGGVLTESGRQGFVTEIMADLYGIDSRHIDIADYHAGLRRGRFNEDKLFTDLNKLYGEHVTKEQFLQKVYEAFQPSRIVYDLAAQLRTKGISTGILSNIFDMNAQVLRKQGWYDDFEPVILSCEVGYAKPDQEIYDAAVEQTGVHPSEILFVDDQDKCIRPATAMGMTVIKAISPKQIVADVRKAIQDLNGVVL